MDAEKVEKALHNVALRKESVDRNDIHTGANYETLQVALRKESVDRNKMIYTTRKELSGRSPQGERG